MGDEISKLAKEIHKRDNKTNIGPCVGVVTNVEPVTVAICDGAVLLEQGDNAKVCQDLVERTYKAQFKNSPVTVTHSSGSTESVKISTDDKLEAKFKEVLKEGDEVLCIPCTGEQTWIIVDKVVS